PQLTAQLQQGEDALRILLGMTPASLNALLAGPENIPVPPKDVAVGIPADLLRRRPDIRSAELQAAAQSEQIGIAEADLFPAFSLSVIIASSCLAVLFVPSFFTVLQRLDERRKRKAPVITEEKTSHEEVAAAGDATRD